MPQCPPGACARTHPSTVLRQHHVLVVVLTSGSNGTDTWDATQLTGTCRQCGTPYFSSVMGMCIASLVHDARNAADVALPCTWLLPACLQTICCCAV